MAAKLSGGGSSKFLIEQNNEINVTPFVDVMLVLLIIFMVVAPLAIPVKIDLPQAHAKDAPIPPKTIYISIKKDDSLYLGNTGKQIDVSELSSELAKQADARQAATTRIFIRADKGTRYGSFMQVMNKLQDSGYYSVALVGEAPTHRR
jgi:biopolymer transport protein ExbD/biopolymer transport protein TolR